MNDTPSINGDSNVLRLALGAPSRQVLNHAQTNGLKNGWKDGFLSSECGFCPSAPDTSKQSLECTLGAVWLQACQRLPNLMKRRNVREALGAMPLVSGTSDTIPDEALWAAAAALTQLSAAVGHEDGTKAIHQHSANVHDTVLPMPILTPISEISKRLNQESCQSTSYLELVSAFVLPQTKSPRPWETEIHTSTSALVELAVQCQELVIKKDSKGLTRILLRMKTVVDGILPVLSRVPPEHLGRRLNPSQPQEAGSSAPNHLGLPLFQLLHTFIGEPSHLQPTSQRLAMQRQCLPINVRAFLVALDSQHSVSQFVSQCGHVQLNIMWEALGKSYHGTQGLLRLYEQKLLLWQSITARTGEAIWIGQDPSAVECFASEIRPARTGHSDNELFAECKVRAKVLSRSAINQDRSRSTALVTLMTPESEGLPFQSGDRLLVMPLNAWVEVEKIAAALGLESILDLNVPLYGGTLWDQFARQLGLKLSLHPPSLSVKDVLRYGQIAPLARDQIVLLDSLFHGTCSVIRKLLESNTWPVMGTLGDLLQRAIEEVSPIIWDTVFDLEHLSWLTNIVPVGIPREYGISSPALMGSSLPSTVKITVDRVRYQVNPQLDSGLESTVRFGMTSEALNAADIDLSDHNDGNEYPLLIGIDPRSALRLRSTHMDHVIMFADSGSVGSFRSFWRSRSNCLGETALFLTHATQQNCPFQEELQHLQKIGQIKVFAACASHTASLDEGRLLSSLVLDMGQYLYEMLSPVTEGGLGGHFYISGTMALYNSIVTGLKRAVHNLDWTRSAVSVDAMLRAALIDGRVILDLHPDPMLTIDDRNSVSVMELALHTGHRPDIQAWFGMNGHVYDLGELYKIQPWHERTLRLQAGIDVNTAVQTHFGRSSDLLSILPAFRVARLASKPSFSSEHIRALHDIWAMYLRSSVESLTAVAYESAHMLSACDSWFSAKNNRDSCFEYLGLQARLLSTGVACIFGMQLQELHLRTSFTHISNARPDSEIPDIMGIVDRARTSAAASKSAEEFKAIFLVSSALRLTHIQASSIVQYAKAVAFLELQLLENVRAEACTAVYMIETAANVVDADSLVDTTLKLLAALERIAARYDAFWQQLALEGIARSCFEQTRFRSRFDIVQIKSTEGIDTSLTIPHPSTLNAQFLYAGQTVSFAHLIDQAMKTVNEESLMAAHARTAQSLHSLRDLSGSVSRGSTSRVVGTAYDTFQHRRAVRSLTEFLGSSDATIKRLSQLPSDLSFAYIMATYGKGHSASGHARSDSAAKTVLRTMDGQSRSETPQPRLIRRRTNTSSLSSSGSHSMFSTPEAGTPETTASSTSSPAIPFQLTLRARDRSTSRAATTPLKHTKGPLPVVVSQPARSLPPSSRKTTVTFSKNLVSSHASTVDGPTDQSRKVKPLPTLLPSPHLHDVRSTNPREGDRAEATLGHPAVPIMTAKIAQHKRNIDQLYTFSVNDGPAGGRARTKHVDTPWLRSISRGHNILDSRGEWFTPEQPPLKFQAPKRSRKVERIFTHSRGDTKANRPQTVETKKLNRAVDQLYSFSISDGPAAGRARTKSSLHVTRDADVESVPHAHYIFANLAIDNTPAAKFAPPRRTRVVERIFTQSRPSTRTEQKFSTKPTAMGRKVDELYSFSVNDGPAAGYHRRRQVSPTSSEPRTYNQQYIDQAAIELRSHLTMAAKSSSTARTRLIERIFTHSQRDKHELRPHGKIVSLKPRMREMFPMLFGSDRKPVVQTGCGLWLPRSDASGAQPSTLSVGDQRTLGYVGMWMQPRSRIVNVDFEQAAATALGDEMLSSRKRFCLSEATAAGNSTLWGQKPGAAQIRSAQTLGYVGLWMLPPSRKINEDFVLLCRGLQISQAQALDCRLTPLRTNQASKNWFVSSGKSMPGARLSGLWSMSVPGSNVAGKTRGYVGMWMRPASRIRNDDFEELQKKMREENRRLWTRRQPRSIPTCIRPEMFTSATTHGLWSPAENEHMSKIRSSTLGSVGLWMDPPSKKVNIDFEKVVVNTMNYLIASQSALLQRMAKDCEIISAHLQRGPWIMTDWTTPGKLEIQSQLVVVLNDSTIPTSVARCTKPPGYVDRTLGQVGLWMYPGSKKRNLDFEAYKAMTDAAPEVKSSVRDNRDESVRPIKLPGHNVLTRAPPMGYTQGSVGLWMNPPSKITNADFEYARQHAHLEAELAKRDVPRHLDTRSAEIFSGPHDATAGSNFPGLPLQGSGALEGESPTLPLQDLYFRPALTPTSAASTESSRIHRGIDFNERLKRLNLELDFVDADLDGETAMNTPTSPPLLRIPSPLPHEVHPHIPSKRPALDRINTQSNRRLDEHGLEILSAVTYTPPSASTFSASILSPVSAHRQQTLPRVLRPVGRTMQSNPSPPLQSKTRSQTTSASASAPQPAPLPRSHSVKPPSRVNNVRDMWEKRASLVMVETPVVPLPLSLRSRTKSPPKPLNLHRNSREMWRDVRYSGGRGLAQIGMREDVSGDGDSATLPPGFEMLNSAMLGGGGIRETGMMSPMSPGVRAY